MTPEIIKMIEGGEDCRVAIADWMSELSASECEPIADVLIASYKEVHVNIHDPDWLDKRLELQGAIGLLKKASDELTK